MLVFRTTWVSQHQKGLILMKEETMEWQWHQLDHLQMFCTSLQTDNHASTSSLDFFIGPILFLMPNQQCESTEGRSKQSRRDKGDEKCFETDRNQTAIDCSEECHRRSHRTQSSSCRRHTPSDLPTPRGSVDNVCTPTSERLHVNTTPLISSMTWPIHKSKHQYSSQSP